MGSLSVNISSEVIEAQAQDADVAKFFWTDGLGSDRPLPTLMYEAELDAFGDGTSAAAIAAERNPTSITTTGVLWGNEQDGLKLTSEINSVSTLDQLITQIDEGMVTGSFQSFEIFDAGNTIFSLTGNLNQWRIETGQVAFQLSGRLPTSLSELSEFAGKFQKIEDFLDVEETWSYGPENSYTYSKKTPLNLSESERIELVNYFKKYDIEALSILDSDVKRAEISVNSDAIIIEVDSAKMELGGVFPEGSLGDVLEILKRFQDSEIYANETLDFNDFDDLSIDTFSLVSDDSDKLAILEGDISTKTNIISTYKINGSSLNDDVEFNGASRIEDVLKLSFDLGDGDDSLTLFGEELIARQATQDWSLGYEVLKLIPEDWGGPELPSPQEVLGGAGQDILIIKDIPESSWSHKYFSDAVSINFATGIITGQKSLKDATIDTFNLSFESIEKASIESQGRLTVLGSEAAEQVTLTHIPTNFLFEGGAGDDTLTLSPPNSSISGIETYGEYHFAHNASSLSQTGTNEKVALQGYQKIPFIVDGGAGSDAVELGGGNDAFFLHDSYSAFNGSVSLALDSFGKYSAQRLNHVERINANDGDDLIDLTSPDYSLENQTITIQGGAGNDIIWGSNGNEFINAGDGNDVIFGGAGNNILTGGLGADEFQFSITSSQDKIKDFNASEGDTLSFFNSIAGQFKLESAEFSGGELSLSYGSSENDLLVIEFDNAGLTSEDVLSAITIM